MFVCSCNAVTDRTVDAVIAAGATTVAEVAARCGAGARCGGCHPELCRRLAEQKAAKAAAKGHAAA
jgi:bacterioferritin-associated ferredoxin